MKRYSESHEWIEEAQGIATVGVTHFAQKELGDVVYVELPKVGRMVKAAEPVSVLESTKAAADVYSPASGKITAVNERLQTEPELINRAAEGDGWLYKIALDNPAELDSLFDAAAYEAKTTGH